MIKIVFFLLLIPVFSFGQYDPKLEEYQHMSIFFKSDTIQYHVYAKGNLMEKSKILLFFHGSGPIPLFSKSTLYDTIQVEENGEMKQKIQKSLALGTCVPFDLDKIPQEYAFVVISKKGVPFLDLEKSYQPKSDFYNNEGLNYRVWQGDQVINDLTKKWIKNPKKVVIIGHSEGSDVVAKLGHVNKKVTHVGYWAGGGNTQYYDFALFIQKAVQRGNMSQSEAALALDSLFSEIKTIENNPTSIDKQWLGNSYRRWAQFTEPSIDNLLKIKKPIFVAVAGKDESVPIESSLLIPIEFIRHKKENLTFKIYPDHDHSFSKPPTHENEVWTWDFMFVFEEFMEWVEEV
jgi:esterase/lipase